MREIDLFHSFSMALKYYMLFKLLVLLKKEIGLLSVLFFHPEPELWFYYIIFYKKRHCSVLWKEDKCRHFS